MTRPVCWSKSWRLTPRMKTRGPVDQQVEADDLDPPEADPEVGLLDDGRLPATAGDA